MFTQTVEYALRIAVCLAETDPKPQTADELARVTHVPRAYLAKVIQAMVRGGAARSKRGVGGGVALAKSPKELTLLDVINAVDPIKRPIEFPIAEQGRGAGLNALHRRSEKALAAVEQVFGEATLAEVVAAGAKLGEGERGRRGNGENDEPPAVSRSETSHGVTGSNGHDGVRSTGHDGVRSTVSAMVAANGNAVGMGHHGVAERPAATGLGTA